MSLLRHNLINQFSQLQVINNYKELVFLCHECVEALNIAEELRKKCLRSEQFFRKFPRKKEDFLLSQSVKVELKEESENHHVNEIELNYLSDCLKFEEFSFECDLCGKKTESRQTLQAHFALDHPE